MPRSPPTRDGTGRALQSCEIVKRVEMACMVVGRLDFAGGAVCCGVLVFLLCFATRDVHVVRLVFLLSQD